VDGNEVTEERRPKIVPGRVVCSDGRLDLPRAVAAPPSRTLSANALRFNP
jgi:hypothetical protein